MWRTDCQGRLFLQEQLRRWSWFTPATQDLGGRAGRIAWSTQWVSEQFGLQSVTFPDNRKCPFLNVEPSHTSVPAPGGSFLKSLKRYRPRDSCLLSHILNPAVGRIDSLHLLQTPWMLLPTCICELCFLWSIHSLSIHVTQSISDCYLLLYQGTFLIVVNRERLLPCVVLL